MTTTVALEISPSSFKQRWTPLLASAASLWWTACSQPANSQHLAAEKAAEKAARKSQPPNTYAGASRRSPLERRLPRSTVTSEKSRMAAIGPLALISERDQAAFSPHGFTPLPSPKRGDWLSEHRERGQTFVDYRDGHFASPNGKRHILYVLPLGHIEANAPTPAALARFASIFFAVKTRVLPALELTRFKQIRWRQRKTGKQAHTSDILDVLKNKLPSDGLALIGITGHDLYPDDEWNFVFGIATLRDRVGVYSTTRYDPSFYPTTPKTTRLATQEIVLRRTLNVMAHEIGHMFGLEHCIYYRCAMNGSNSLSQTDTSPLHLCPVCLRKLKHSVKFDIVERYQRLERHYRNTRLEPEANWLAERLLWIQR